ncbi:MAG: D-alanine--D-alanine ligase, partial [Candidatus Latescibacterota bacterium]
MTSKKHNILFLVGGDSAERDVSYESGRSMYDALIEYGHRVIIADPGRPDIPPSADAADYFANAKLTGTPPSMNADVFEPRTRFMEYLCRFRTMPFDVVFNALHGGAGEDGTLQACLDYLGIPYTGSGAVASALAMNKDLSKRLVAAAGVPVIAGLRVASSASHDAKVIDAIHNEIGFPLVVKPNQQGSSVGVSIVTEAGELAKALSVAAALDRALIIERFIDGSELTASILGNEVLPLIEIRPKAGFYDYRNKYTSGASDYLVPAPLDEKTTEAVKSSAMQAYRAHGCRAYARVDFRLAKGGEHYYLEVNTLPGMTANSLVPKAAAAAG